MTDSQVQPTVIAPSRLSTAVRTGNLAKFNETLAKFGQKFQSENTYTLILRLRHNVIKTGVRMISLSYSRISLTDIAQKLTLDSPEDAEFIVAKVGHGTVMSSKVLSEWRECCEEEGWHSSILSTAGVKLWWHE